VHGFPAALTSFIGRAGPVGEVAGLLAQYRLVTVTGPGGSGKTRLAGEVAGRVASRFADGVWLAELGPVQDQGLVPAAVGAALGIREQPGVPAANAVARVEALGVAQLLDRLDDRFGLLVAGDRLAAGRQRSLAATVEWSYRLLDEDERRVFRAVSVFPAGFTLEAAEAVAGAGAGPTVLRLVDCSLLSPPRVGPDGRSRYVMLERLRAYGAALLAQAGEQPELAAAQAGFALGVAGLLDAEAATIRQVLAWAMINDAATGCGWRSRLRRGGSCGPAGGSVPVAARCGRARPGGQRRVVRRAHLARPGRHALGRSGRGTGLLHRGPGRPQRPAAVPDAGGLPARPVGDTGEPGPGRRGR